FLNHSSTRPPGRRWKRIDAVCLAAAGWPAATAPGLVGSAGIGPLVVAGAVLTAGAGALRGLGRLRRYWRCGRRRRAAGGKQERGRAGSKPDDETATSHLGHGQL